jgi:choline dehydrogenase-like flavoprotein
MTEPDFDAVVVGASVAGCTAARLFAQRGARVALVERRPDLDAYKTVCTHYSLIWPEDCQVRSTESPAVRGFLLVWEAAGGGLVRDARSH